MKLTIDFRLRKKILLSMKMTAILVLITCLQVSARVNSQSITYRAKNAKLEDAFSVIKKQTGYVFFYSYSLLDKAKPINVDVKNASLKEMLDLCFKDQPFNYEIKEKTIVITAKPEPVKEIQPTDLFPPPTPPTIEIKGTVSDSAGQPLKGASIKLKGTNLGTTSDDKGNFLLKIPEKGGVLEISYIGYEVKELKVSKSATIAVALKTKETKLDDIIVVGYGTQKKVTSTGAISSVKGEDIVKTPTPNVTNSLVGRFSGLTAVTSSGEPGNDDALLRIRGVNTLGDASALIVIDGIAGRPLGRLDANDIESVTILKDASAAIYGAQAANGVVLITTRRGKSGKLNVTFNLNQGITQATVLPKMANAAQYATMINEIDGYTGTATTYTPADITLFGNGTDPWGHPNTDWFKEVLKPWSNQTAENVTISGGNEKTRFLVSLGGKYQDAIYQRSSTNYSQFNFKSNIDTKLTNDISLAFDVVGRQENRNNLSPAVGSGNLFEYTLRGKPTMNAFWPNGMPGPDIENGMNPAVVETDIAGYTKDVWNIFQSNVKLNINIPWVKGLSITANASYDAQFELYKGFQKPWSLYVWDGVSKDPVTGLPLLVESVRGPSTPNLTESTQNMHTITTNALINYERKFKAHTIKVLVGNERGSFLNNSFGAYRTNYQSSILDQLFAGGNVGQTNTGQATQTARVSYFGRVNYNFSEKYLLEFVWRYDGSNNFAPGKQFGFFPGVSAGWRISEEKFWKDNLSFINNFKIRGSLGKTGNDRISPYQYLANYAYNTSQTYILGNQVQNPLLSQTYIPNVNVTWETAIQRNIGFESQFLNNKLGVEFDYFKYNRSDILWQASGTVPGSTGITSQLPAENIAKVSNKGFEIVLSYKDKIKDFSYNISVNGSYAKNKVDYIDEPAGVPAYQTITGKSLPSDIYNFQYSLYYQATGVFKDQAQINATPHWAGAQPGDLIFKDVNGDGVIDGRDQVRSDKNNIPTFTGGLNIELKYKQFDFSLLFQGAEGAVHYNGPYAGLVGNFLKDFADNRWTPTNTSASYPKAYNNSEYWTNYRNTFFLHSSDYVRLKNIVIGYSTSAKFNKLIKAQSLRFYVSALNLFTLTKLKNFDPEITDERGYSYPLQRVINGGITLNF